MLHRATRLLPEITGATACRRFSGDQAVAEQMFKEAWKKVVPNMDPPKSPLCLMQPRTLVDMIIVPATTGQMGILPGHVATMTELKPGVLSVHKGNETTKYFVSGGFAFIHPNSIADIITNEAVPLDRIDPNLVQKGLAEYSQKLSAATTDYEKAEAQIGVDVHSALNYALTG